MTGKYQRGEAHFGGLGLASPLGPGLRGSICFLYHGVVDNLSYAALDISLWKCQDFTGAVSYLPPETASLPVRRPVGSTPAAILDFL